MDDDTQTSPLRLPVDLDELESAIFGSGFEQHYFLNLETGAVLGISSDSLHLADELLSSLPAGVGLSPEIIEEFAAERGMHDWQVDELQHALPVATDDAARFIEFEPPTSSDGFQDMLDFVETVGDDRTRYMLEGALGGKGSFRRFKDIVDRSEDVRQQWFAFRDARQRAYILNWLRAIGIEPTSIPANWPTLGDW